MLLEGQLRHSELVGPEQVKQIALQREHYLVIGSPYYPSGHYYMQFLIMFCYLASPVSTTLEFDSYAKYNSLSHGTHF